MALQGRKICSKIPSFKLHSRTWNSRGIMTLFKFYLANSYIDVIKLKLRWIKHTVTSCWSFITMRRLSAWYCIFKFCKYIFQSTWWWVPARPAEPEWVWRGNDSNTNHLLVRAHRGCTRNDSHI
jgi:hypothetical protein